MCENMLLAGEVEVAQRSLNRPEVANMVVEEPACSFSLGGRLLTTCAKVALELMYACRSSLARMTRYATRSMPPPLGECAAR